MKWMRQFHIIWNHCASYAQRRHCQSFFPPLVTSWITAAVKQKEKEKKKKTKIGQEKIEKNKEKKKDKKQEKEQKINHDNQNE